MNESNSISNTTRLYGFIAEKAQQNRFSVTLNRMFKAAHDDAMMIPMNIREDDFYFTLSNMKRSHLSGAMISREYQQQLGELLERSAALVRQSGFCDFVHVTPEGLHGIAVAPEAMAQLLGSLHVKKIAIIGSTPLVAALALRLEALEVSFFDPYIESLMALGERIDREIDINRIAEGMTIDLSAYDALIACSEIEDFDMIRGMPRFAIAPEHGKKSNLAALCGDGCHYLDADAMLENYCATLHEILMKEQ